MSYQVIARKYRPQGFDDLLGQEHIVKTLTNAIKTNRVAHAYLFTGARGIGKTSAARILTKALNCIQGPTVTPCHVCQNCVEITQGNANDVFEIDGASNTSVEDIRDLRENVRYLPAKSRFKIYIIDEVHMLSTSAFNALLKTLEEPPAHVKFIFATTEPHKIPATILSRCQRFDFKRIPSKVLLERLGDILKSEGVQYDEAGLHIIINEAEGSMRDAQSLLEQVISYCGDYIKAVDVVKVLGIADRTALYDYLAAILGGDADKALQILDTLYEYGVDLKSLINSLVRFIRDMLIIKTCKNPADLLALPADEIAKLSTLAAPHAESVFSQLFFLFLKSLEDLKETIYPKLVLEVATLKAMEVRSLHLLEEIMERLNSLEQKIGEGNPVQEGNRGRSSQPVTASDFQPPREKKTASVPAPVVPSKKQNGSSPALPLISVDPEKDFSQAKARILQEINQENPYLGALVEQGQLTELKADKLFLALEKGSMVFNNLSKKENIEQIEAILKRLFGKKISLTLIQTEQSVDSFYQAKLQKTKETKESLREQALKHPAVAEIKERFKAEIKEVIVE